MSNLALPTLEELVSQEEKSYEQNALTVLLNQQPPTKWLKKHPSAKVKDENGNSKPADYLPIDKVEYLLTRMFKAWWVEVKTVQLIANSVQVTVRLWVVDPITLKERFNDGVGAAPIQTDAGSSATDWTKVKSAGVQMAAPAAETYAIKDAAEKFGRIFGRDLSRINTLSYDSMLQQRTDYDELVELFEFKKHALSETDLEMAERIIKTKEVKSYINLFKKLQEA